MVTIVNITCLASTCWHWHCVLMLAFSTKHPSTASQSPETSSDMFFLLAKTTLKELTAFIFRTFIHDQKHFSNTQNLAKMNQIKNTTFLLVSSWMATVLLICSNWFKISFWGCSNKRLVQTGVFMSKINLWSPLLGGRAVTASCWSSIFMPI